MVGKSKTAPYFPHCVNMAVHLLTWVRVESTVAVKDSKHSVSSRACPQHEDGGACLMFKLGFLRGELT